MSVEQLRRQREAIKAKLIAAKNFVNRIIDNLETTTKKEIESLIKNLDDTLVKFQIIAQQLLTVASKEEYERRDETEETEFEDRYFSIKAHYCNVSRS